ncbi:unnamed protein product [Orchesella dallaii]|uniref:Uncharacterized protein n=1 Tax=Orchesella dallaii TaxID=48710 RepID=A0ABP1RHI8_9HEXA
MATAPTIILLNNIKCLQTNHKIIGDSLIVHCVGDGQYRSGLGSSATVRNPTDLIYDRDIRALPTIKLFVDINNYNKTTTFHVDCNGFCNEKQMKFDPEAGDKMLSVLDYHKLLFWNGNGKLVDTELTIQDLGSFLYFEKDPLKCLRHIMEYRADVRKSYLCGSLIMATSYLTQTHNLTIKLHDFFNTSDANRVDKSGHYMFISGPYALKILKKNFLHLTSTILALQDSTKVIYCKTKKVHKMFTLQHYVWVEPFSAELVATWFMLHILACIVAMNYSNSSKVILLLRNFLQELMQLLLLALREIAIPLRKSIYICIAIVGMLNAWFYENTITSLVTVATPEYPMKNLQEVVTSDYKILYKTTITDFPTRYRNLFRISKLEDRINSSYIETNAGLTLEVIAEYFSHNNKIAVFMQESDIERTRWKIQSEINQNVKFLGTKCYVASDSFMPNFYYWQIFTNNLEWLKISMSRMANGGLVKF